jgi:hypothetical protein
MRREIIFGAVGLAMILAAALVLWPGEPSPPPEMAAAAPAPDKTKLNSPSPETRYRIASPAFAQKPVSSIIQLDTIGLDVKLVLDSIEAESDETRREELMQAAVESVASTDLAVVISSLQNADQTPLSVALQLRLVRRWAGTDPQSAAAWVAQTPSGEARQEAINAVAIEWANRNFAGTLEWARRLSNETEKQGALVNSAYEAARLAPVEALSVASEIENAQERDNLVTHATMQWASASPEQAAAWAKQIDDAELRQRVLTGVATAWGERDPVSAAKLALQFIAPGRMRDDALIGIVQRWVQKDPRTASSWVNEFPKGQLRETAMEIISSLGKSS